MGQEQSQEVVKEVSREELSHELALKFAERCYSQLELYCFKQVFNNLADTESDVKYWSEASLCRYLELPDALGVGPVIYQMATFLGAFPFPSQAPCIVTKEALIKVVTIMTERYTRVLKRGSQDRMRLLYGALSVYDRRVSEALNAKPDAAQALKVDTPEVAVVDTVDGTAEATRGIAGFAIDEPMGDIGDDDDDDTLTLAALDALDAIDAVKLGEKPEIQHSFIPTDNLLKLIELLLLVAPLGPQESVSKYASYLDDKGLDQLRRTAGDILSSFGIEEVPGINYRTFRHIVPSLMPFMFDGFSPLFEHFLFNKEFDLSKRRRRSSQTSQEGQSPSAEQLPSFGHRRRSSGSGTEPFPSYPSNPPQRRTSALAVRTRGFSTASTIPENAVVLSPTSPAPGADYFPAVEEMLPLLPEGDHLLTYPILSQLAFFLSPALIFHRLYHLYAGAEQGFSINSLNASVSTWTGPSILLVSGTLLSSSSSSTESNDSRERNFHNRLPPRRYQPDGKEGARVLYGAYLPMQLRPTHRTALSDPKALLFQLGPTHDVFPASTLNTAHLTFSNSSTDPVPGIGVGCALPLPTSVSGSQHAIANLGAVSMHLDDALEFGVFTHTAAGGGSFKPSAIPHRRQSNWEDRFEVDAIEMWGIGGETQVRDQRRALEFEEREARLRREGRGSVSAGGVEADRELLRMAGIIGKHSESGGSMS